MVYHQQAGFSNDTILKSTVASPFTHVSVIHSLGPIEIGFQLRENSSTTAYNAFSDNIALLILWLQFGEHSSFR